MNPQPIVLINSFEVPRRRGRSLPRRLGASRAFLSTQDGYLSTRLHRSFSPSADFRFVNVAYCESAQAFQAATARPEFTNAHIPVPFHASLYEVVRDNEL
jgi:heme-degrading monooxygenase HmoA